MMTGFRLVEKVTFHPGGISTGIAGPAIHEALADGPDHPWRYFGKHVAVRARKIWAAVHCDMVLHTEVGDHYDESVFLHFDSDDLSDSVNLPQDSELLDSLEPQDIPGCYYVIHEDLTAEIVPAAKFEAEYRTEG